MAAIREWFAGYGIIFDYIRDLGGEQGLQAYLQAMGVELCEMIGLDRSDPLEAIRGYFADNTAKDGGRCEINRQPDSLTVHMELCPDHAYFRNTPYDSHRFGSDYCFSCRGIYSALARRAGFGFTSTEPIQRADGARSCCFNFTGEDLK